MIWVIIILATNLSWALVNVGDKYIIGHRIKNFIVYFIWLAYIGLYALFLIPFIDFFIPPLSMLVLLFVASAIFSYSALPYAKALKIENVTRINVWWSMVPIFTLLIAWLAIDEHLKGIQLIAFVILVAGSFLASLRFEKGKKKISKGLWYMVIAAFGYAICATIFRYLALDIPFSVLFVWGSIFNAIAFSLLLISRGIRLDFVKYWKTLTPKLSGGIAGIAIVDNLGLLFNIWAFSLVPAALVNSLIGTQAIFVFIIAVIIHRFSPVILKEEMDIRNVIMKISAIALVAVGIAVLYLGG
ncbi:MAG: DMT family transporter [Parcubacteria group bacterium]